jgi:hypothetical protein
MPPHIADIRKGDIYNTKQYSNYSTKHAMPTVNDSAHGSRDHSETSFRI